MSSEQHRLSHVSDTALMTAACRALETDRPDGWIRDPLAARVAGDRGLAIARHLPVLEVMSFGVGMRTRILDELLPQAIVEHGISTVLSLGAGLDTRPWRLDLPGSLRWVEVDLQPILDYKAEKLAGVTPRCRLEQRVADLNDTGQRRDLFRALGDGKALMITEGLLMYLPATTIHGLAIDARQSPTVRFWALDAATRVLSQAIRVGGTMRDVDALRDPDHLEGEEILHAVEKNGWSAIESRTYPVWAAKLMPPGRMASFDPEKMPPPPPPDDRSGVHLFGAA
jgi:methyltransferase (TIGR00027 family)